MALILIKLFITTFVGFLIVGISASMLDYWRVEKFCLKGLGFTLVGAAAVGLISLWVF